MPARRAPRMPSLESSFADAVGGGDPLTVSKLRVDPVRRFFHNPNRRALRRDGSVGNRDAVPANEFVNEPDRKSELDDLRSGAQRGRPFGSED